MLRMTHLSFSTQWATYFYRVFYFCERWSGFFCTFVRTKTKPVASRSQRTINSRKKCGYKFLLNSGFFSTIQNSNAGVSCCFFLFIQYLSSMTVSVSFWLTLPSMWQSVADLWPRVVWNRNLSLCVPFSPPLHESFYSESADNSGSLCYRAVTGFTSPSFSLHTLCSPGSQQLVSRIMQINFLGTFFTHSYT